MSFNPIRRSLLAATLGALSLGFALPALSADKVVVYSARKDHLIKPLFDAYTAKTGVEIDFITDKEGPLLQRLKAEGRRTPADLLITVDAGNLWHAAHEGVLAKIDSAILNGNVPAHLRDPDGQWFGLSIRARTIVRSTDRVPPSELSTYEDLADPKWKGRLCLRTSKKVYNQSLVAMMIARHGMDEAERIVKGWVANLAEPPFSNDTKAMQAVAAGKCDVTVVNTYYFGRLQKSEPNLPLAIFWPNQGQDGHAAGTGVHVNISGAGVTRYAKHPQAAQALLEWLSSDEAQALFASLNMEYPVKAGVEIDPLVAAWGGFKADETNLAEAGRLQAEAVKLMDRAGYK
ncbi:MAG: Fe(3+) ABC transporter substrate-binding protein [Gammaproteobacteria bacterium]|nr:Fe(3+) ABC transporter substrate-binding protein [Gammaproteobacteria bacterium]MCP5137830.1 Fe(3+) ABC transporter substrate-binding protein [Gammaproteobacteria bacterium]